MTYLLINHIIINEDKTIPVMINTAHIAEISKAQKTNNAIIKMTFDTTYYTEETFEQLLSVLGVAHPVPLRADLP